MPTRWTTGRQKINSYSGRTIGQRYAPRAPVVPSAVVNAPGVLNRTLVNKVMGLELELVSTWIGLR